MTNNSTGLKNRDRAILGRSTQDIPIAINHATGATLVDVDGSEYTDLTSGWNVANVGWQHPKIVESIVDQATKLTYAPPWCTNELRVRLAEELSTVVGQECLSICAVSGAEAIEMALKVARRATNRHHVVGFTHAYHGSTLGAMLAGGMRSLQRIDIPDDKYHRHAPIPDMLRMDKEDYLDTVYQTITSQPIPAAVLLEPLFTNPGVLFGTPEFYHVITEATKKVGAVLIVDEIGTGFARTGSFFAYEHFDLDPDIIVVAKAMSGGAVPIAGALVKPHLRHGIRGPAFYSTFGFTPLACAAAIANIKIIAEERLVERADKLGRKAMKYLTNALKDFPHIAEIRGKGLEIGIEVVDNLNNPLSYTEMAKIPEILLEDHILVGQSNYISGLILMPPLTIDESVLFGALDRIVYHLQNVQLPML